MNPPDKCRVDDCDRNAAASIVRDNLPGPLPLCATHTEDFRMNSAGWTVTWEHTLAEPTSVKTAAPTAVGRMAPGPAGAPRPNSAAAGRFKSRLGAWRSSRS
jgi:hypothetical protein